MWAEITYRLEMGKGDTSQKEDRNNIRPEGSGVGEHEIMVVIKIRHNIHPGGGEGGRLVSLGCSDKTLGNDNVHTGGRE